MLKDSIIVLVIFNVIYFSCDEFTYHPDKMEFTVIDVSQVNNPIINLFETDTLILWSFAKINYASDRKIYNVDIYFDGTKISSTDNQNWFVFNTRSFNDGFHEMIFDFTVSTGTKSLADQLDLEKVNFQINKIAIIDNSMPTPIDSFKVDYENGYPKLTWAKNKDLNFVSYSINRKLRDDMYMVSGLAFSRGNFDLYDPDQTTFIDSSYVPLYGPNEIIYHITKTNGMYNTTSTQLLTFSYGTTIPALGKIGKLSKNKDTLYVANPDSNTLSIISTDNHLLVKKLFLDYNNDGRILNIESNYEREKLYILTDNKIFKLNYQNELDFVYDIGYSNIAIGKNEKLYFVQNYLKCIDTKNDTIYGNDERLLEYYNLYDPPLYIDELGNRLLVFKESSFAQDFIFEVDISNNNMIIQDTIEVNCFYNFCINENHDLLIVSCGSKRIDIYNLADFNQIMSIQPYISSMSTFGNYLFVNSHLDGSIYKSTIYLLPGFQIVKELIFGDYPYLVYDDLNKTLYANFFSNHNSIMIDATSFLN